MNSSVRNDESMIGNVCDYTSDEYLTVYTNGGSTNFTHIAPFKFLPMEVYFNTDSMAKILEIKNVASIPGVNISMDSRNDRAIVLEYQNQMIKLH